MTQAACSPRPRVRWRPLRVYTDAPDLGVTVSSVYGYRAECACGWQGKVRRQVSDVQADARYHFAECDG